MSLETLLRLALVPAAVWVASLAARRWGHTVSGYLGGMPLIGGPITLFLALDHGSEFAARSAVITLAAVAGQAAHLLAFAHVGRRRRWPIALASGWAAFLAVAAGVTFLPLTPAIAIGIAAAALAIAWRAMPAEEGAATRATIPASELRLRLVASFALAAAILWSARTFGPVVSGVLLSLPITGSIMPPFTLALHGHAALVRLLRGFVRGLAGFSSFFLVVGALLPRTGIAAAFATAALAALAAVFLVSRVTAGRKP